MSRKARLTRSNRPKKSSSRTVRASSLPSAPETVAPETAAPQAIDFPGTTGELQAKFFEELPSDAWLAHELELRHPRLLQKMTESVARRRAHFARYVVGVVAVSAALCVAALVKAAVPGAADRGDGMGPTSVQGAAADHVDDAPGTPSGASLDTGTHRGP